MQTLLPSKQLAYTGVSPGTWGSATQIPVLTVNAEGQITAASVDTVGFDGTVTSVGLTMPSMFSVSGSPVTTAGTLAISWQNQSANTILSGPASGSSAAPTFRALVSADIPSLSGLYLPLSGGTLTGELQVTPTSTSSPLISATLPSSYNGMGINVLDNSGQTVFEAGWATAGNATIVLGGITNTLEPARIYMGFGEAPTGANDIFAYLRGANRIGGSYIVGGELTFTSSQAWTSGSAQGTTFAVSLCPNDSATLKKYFEVTSQGDVVANATGTALSTSATDGFLYLGNGSGPPTGSPSAFTGATPLYFDSLDSVLYAYNGSWAAVGSNLSFLPLAGGTLTGSIVWASGQTFPADDISGTVAIANGGTGLTSTSQNYAFIGPTSGSGAPSWRALVAGDIPSLSYISSATTQTANTFLSGPSSGSASAPTFRAMVLADLPATYANIGASLAQGSVVYSNASGNLTVLAPGTSGQLLQTQGASANPVWAPGVGGSNTQVQFNSSGTFSADAGFTYGGAGGSTLVALSPTSTSATVIEGTLPASFAGYGLKYLDSSSAVNLAFQQSTTQSFVYLTSPTGSSSQPSFRTGLQGYQAASGSGFGAYNFGAFLSGTWTNFAGIIGTATESQSSGHQGAGINFYITPNGTTSEQIAMTLGSDSVTTITGNTVLSYPQDVYLNFTSTKTLELPAAANCPGSKIAVKWVVQNSGTVDCTISAAGGNVEGGATYSLASGSATYPSLLWESDGTNWWIIASTTL